MSLYEAVANLPLVVDSYSLEGLSLDVGRFVRRTTVIRLAGAGHEGVGEDPTYDGDDQAAFQNEGPTLPLASSRHTIDSFSELLDRLALFPSGPSDERYRSYRRWAFESAALDLALRQAGASLADAVGREPRPLRFVASMRLGEPASAEPVLEWRAAYPDLRFKLDPTSSWTDAVVADLAATGAVDIVDLKGAYHGTPVDQAPEPTLYARVATAFPDAWIEDPALTEETAPVLEPHRRRITWDAPIHSVADIRGLPFPPQTLNFKPSRFGSIRGLFEAYEHCAKEGIALYGGGQFELGPGRGQIQYLASLFHADGPNDTAPSSYNEGGARPGLPTSPLAPTADAVGFRWLSAES